MFIAIIVLLNLCSTGEHRKYIVFVSTLLITVIFLLHNVVALYYYEDSYSCLSCCTVLLVMYFGLNLK